MGKTIRKKRNYEPKLRSEKFSDKRLKRQKTRQAKVKKALSEYKEN